MTPEACKKGIQSLLMRMNKDLPEYREALLLEARLERNIADTRKVGDNPILTSQWIEIIDLLNDLSLRVLHVSFNSLASEKQLPLRFQRSAKERNVSTKPTPQIHQVQKRNDTRGNPTSLYGTGNRWAVLVGINYYEDKDNYGQLNVSVKDVEAIYKQLTVGGFISDRIHLLTDNTPEELPTRNNILATLATVAKATETNDTLLFYFSGHGDEAGRSNYLVPRDGRVEPLKLTTVPISKVKEILQQAPARAKVIIIDACHAGVNIRKKGPRRMSAGFIRRVFENAAGLVILSSCEKGEFSYELQTQEHSVFTHYLLEALQGKADYDRKGFVTVQDANRHVSDKVKLWASKKKLAQTPTLESKIEGDIILCNYGSQFD